MSTAPNEAPSLLRMYRAMVYIRAVEQGIADRYAEQEMRCPVHLSIGQEGTAVGVCHALAREDRAYSTHRCHAHYLAKGGDLKAMLAEIYGKAAGCIGGRGGSMHLMDTSVGMFLSVPIVGSSIPLAAGGALSDKMAKNGHVNVAFIGDASIEEGVFHETANFASLHKLPVIFACENNLYSVYTPITKRQPARPITDVAKAHGIPAAQADGNDVEAVYQVTQEALSRARAGKGPTLLLFDTYRWREHCGPNFDNQIGYRTEAEYESWRKRCPVEVARAKLMHAKLLDEAADAAIAAELKSEIDAAFAFAKTAPLPSPAQAADHIYA